jgi:replicative DNA helicase
MKLPPQNIEAEESLLCACLLSGKVRLSDDLSGIADALTPDDFYKTAHKHIFTAVANLLKNKQVVDLSTVYLELKRLGLEKSAGGATYLSKLTDQPIATDMVYYTKLVKAAAVGRKIIETAQEIAVSVYDQALPTADSVVELLDKAQASMLNINFDLNIGTFIPFADACHQRVDDYESMYKIGRVPGVRTGFRTIDLLTGGFYGSKLIVIAARPRVGKTALMLNMAKNIAADGHKVGIFSIEMDKEELLDRQIAGISGINSIKLSTGYGITPDDWGKIHEAANKIYTLPIFIDDTGGLTVQEIKRRARIMKKAGVKIIFIDQLSKIRGGQGRSEYEQRSFILNELATLKKELRIPICLLAQINRNADNRPNSKPTLQDLKSTGAIEEDADIVIIGHRPFLYTQKEEDERKATWEIAKHRQGATKNVDMFFDAKTTTFYELTKEYSQT